MTTLQSYLNHYYQTTEAISSVCNISTQQLVDLIDEKLVPSASYRVISPTRCISQAFGELHCVDLVIEKYFHPGNQTWINLAVEFKRTLGAKQAYQALNKRFRSNYARALLPLNQSIHALTDCYSPQGVEMTGGMAKRTSDAWTHFINGIFSLCVADPSSEQSIANKEVLQEALIGLTQKSSTSSYSIEQRQQILRLVEQYELAAMPFSPQEYPNSSRKKLVEDLRIRLK